MAPRLILALVAACVLAWSPPPASAATEEEAVLLSPDQVAALTRVEDYLNQLDTLQARFVQISSNGSYAEGELIVERPGSLRFDYDPPHTALLIASGLTLLYYDKELKQASFLPLWETPLWWLVRERVVLGDELQVIGVEEGLGTLSVSLRDRENPDSGEVTLVFSDAPLVLRRWEVLDTQGIALVTAWIGSLAAYQTFGEWQVAPQFGVEVDEDTFDYSDLEINRGQREQHR